MLTDSLPYWPINPSITNNPFFNFQLDVVRCLWVVLPGAILWGASFPLALAAVAAPGQDPGRLVGGVYAANTVGAIVGSARDGPGARRLDRHADGGAAADRHLGHLGTHHARADRGRRGEPGCVGGERVLIEAARLGRARLC